MLPLARKLIGSERLRHAAIAVALAALVGVTTILRPLDITVWSLQSKLFEHAPSQNIAFVEIDRAQALEASPSENRELLQALRVLNEVGAERIYLDFPLQRSGSLAVDTRLRDELAGFGDKVVLTRAVRQDFQDNRPLRASDPFFERGMRVVSNDYQVDFLGYVWGIERSYSGKTRNLVTLWRDLAGSNNPREILSPSYSINANMIPRYDVDRIVDGDQGAAPLAGKSVVIGPPANDSKQARIPGQGTVAPSIVHIVAAETAIRGAGQIVDWAWMLALFGSTLIAGLFVANTERRREQFYGIWTATLFAVILATAYFGVRAFFVGPLVLAVTYALQRGAIRFKRRHLFIEPRSKLPNFVALQRDMDDIDGKGANAIVVAKIARLDAIFATLSLADQGRYLRQIAARLALGESGPTIYYDGGKYFAFVASCEDFQDFQGHLEGLRAIASQSITVSQGLLDVSMTMGVDSSRSSSSSSRLSSAIAAADQAREAYRPVFVISDLQSDQEEWDYSLQARLESALSEDRISIKIQPQAELRDGKIVGVEALARWVDEEKGEISPARFILQCERVGKLDELTKRILSKSLDVMDELAAPECVPRISVNVSAIQFVDSRIADLIERNLAMRDSDPARLMIEVTETARIENFAVARDIFEQIKRLGVRFSMDDFGVASANLEALFELPFDEIKVDQMFVQRVHQSTTARAIVSNVTRLASDAGLLSVAEGIEDQETYSMLRDMGCDIGQGYFIGRPMAFSQLREMIELQRDGSQLRDRFG